jgi:hypothetical protein
MVLGPRDFAPLQRLAAARGGQADVHRDVLEDWGGWGMIRRTSLPDYRNKIKCEVIAKTELALRFR